MKRFTIVCVSLFILLTSAGCQSSNVEELSLEIENLKKENDLLKSELKEAIDERDKLIEEIEGSKAVPSGKEEEVLVEVVDKINKPKDVDNWILDDRVNFHISISNNSKKDIREIQGVLDIKNTSGVSILRTELELSGEIIKVGETFINKDTFIKINEYKNQDLRLYRAEHDDLRYTYKINKIIYTE